jgi:Xaa-Pro aminopeptidase
MPSRVIVGDTLRVPELRHEVHERPWLGRYGEDLVLVTDDGCENLTEFPYDLEL